MVLPRKADTRDGNNGAPNSGKSLKNKKAPGPDKIPNEVIKMIAENIPNKLAKINNQCIKQGRFADKWKKARLVLLRKHDKPLNNLVY